MAKKQVIKRVCDMTLYEIARWCKNCRACSEDMQYKLDKPFIAKCRFCPIKKLVGLNNCPLESLSEFVLKNLYTLSNNTIPFTESIDNSITDGFTISSNHYDEQCIEDTVDNDEENNYEEEKNIEEESVFFSRNEITW